MSIKLVVADDHQAVLAGLKELVSAFKGIELVATAIDSKSLVDVLTRQYCDVALIDFSMPHGPFGDGVTLIQFLKRRFPHVRLAVLTGIENEDVLHRILDLGVHAVVSKADDCEHYETAIRKAFNSDAFLSPHMERMLQSSLKADEVKGAHEPLTKRELEVLRLLAQGLSVKEIGEHVSRSRKTISSQKVSLMKKLGLSTDADIYHYAVVHKLTSTSQASQSLHSMDDPSGE